MHRLLLNKYYVDEIYDAAVVQPIRVGSQEALWRGFDVRRDRRRRQRHRAIVAGGAGVLRRLQTGSVRAYAGSMFIGVVVILGYYLWNMMPRALARSSLCLAAARSGRLAAAAASGTRTGGATA